MRMGNYVEIEFRITDFPLEKTKELLMAIQKFHKDNSHEQRGSFTYVRRSSETIALDVVLKKTVIV